MIDNKPSIYNQASIYNQGAPVLYSSVDINGVVYDAMTFKKLQITTENLNTLIDGDIVINDNMLTYPAACYPNNDQANAIAKKYNLLYNPKSLELIQSKLSEGWRVATFSDLQYLETLLGLKNLCVTGTWGGGVATDTMGVSLVANGNHESGGGFYNIGTAGGLITTKNGNVGICTFAPNGQFTFTALTTRYAAIRLCRDL